MLKKNNVRTCIKYIKFRSYACIKKYVSIYLIIYIKFMINNSHLSCFLILIAIASAEGDEKASFPTRNFPQDNSSSRRDSARVYMQRVVEKEGRNTGASLLSIPDGKRKRKDPWQHTRCSVSYTYIYIYMYVLNKSKLVRVCNSSRARERKSRH